MLDRLLDLLLIATLREWFAREDAPGWYRAYEDPVVGPALRMPHHEPARAWTVVELARAVGVSRAALARRFNELVGEPPMAFLTGWRIALAADAAQPAPRSARSPSRWATEPVRAEHGVQAGAGSESRAHRAAA